MAKYIEWEVLNKARLRRERAAKPLAAIPRRSLLSERHTEPDPAFELLDSRGQPISLPRVSILERKR